MKTQTFLKKANNALLIIALFFSQHMLAQQNKIVETESPTHSIIFIFSIVFFILGFALFIILKLREDAKEKREGKTTFHPTTKHRHLHPNHYGHRHQYHHH